MLTFLLALLAILGLFAICVLWPFVRLILLYDRMIDEAKKKLR